ncbi:uncharacterized protein PV06_00506 [Exophiala oligosperma]|uniref:Uncharacterized protein n=2 Tax=Chaetothyriales TaxID=34395 RepID=A0A0D2DXL9_9EURO|nr:uncharacterized protein PV06_00506 [Exophiala oligosperma]KAJ9626810.1 hypothetical protein H2204_009826 [Knufia peltigerae]KIW47848.1 hypothetical protein PV06_00506 [Exophiala oligosperma]
MTGLIGKAKEAYHKAKHDLTHSSTPYASHHHPDDVLDPCTFPDCEAFHRMETQGLLAAVGPGARTRISDPDFVLRHPENWIIYPDEGGMHNDTTAPQGVTNTEK